MRTSVISGIVLCLVLACCGGQAKPVEFPKSVAAWTLTTTAGNFEIPRPKNALRVRRATYAGPVEVIIDMYDLPDSTAAFETLQGWIHLPGTLAINHGAQFIVVKSPSAESSATFLDAFQKAL